MGSVQEIRKAFRFCSPTDTTLKTLARTSLHTKLAELLQLMHPVYEAHAVQI
jgi:hypothetical protein